MNNLKLLKTIKVVLILKLEYMWVENKETNFIFNHP